MSVTNTSEVPLVEAVRHLVLGRYVMQDVCFGDIGCFVKIASSASKQGCVRVFWQHYSQRERHTSAHALLHAVYHQ